ncbi:MAG: DUF1214 domain-containing protein [Halioglobus sp.]|nr:DUF1214 domain-containing protein [Halioglobus sp.]
MSSEQDQALAQSLLSGEAWRTFCDELKAAGDLIVSDQVPQSPLQKAEGFRYLTRVMRMGLEMVLEHGNPAAPQLWFQDETVKSGGDNPDNLYYWGRIRGSYSYRLSGELAQPEYLSINIYAGGLNRPGGRRIVADLDLADLQLDSRGRFNLLLARERPDQEGAGQWVPITDDAGTVLVRETVADRNAARSEFHIERLEQDKPPEPLDPLTMAKALRSVAGLVHYSSKYFGDMARQWSHTPNTFFASDADASAASFGNLNYQYPSAYFEVGTDEALLIRFQPPQCVFWSLVLYNYWMESLDYRYRPIHLNKVTAQLDDEGFVKIVIAHRDPQLEGFQWLDVEGHTEGILTLRFVGAEPQPLPRIEKVAWSSLHHTV